jgi:hypothetical protein
MTKRPKNELYLELFVQVLLMGKGFFVGKRVISIQFSKDNTFQSAIANPLICLIILRVKVWLSKQLLTRTQTPC